MSLSRFFPIGLEDDPWRSFAADLQRMNQQMRRMNENYNSLLPSNPASPINIGMNEVFRMDNPIITDKDGNKKFQLDFDLRQFKPEEIELTTKDNVLSVHAKHEEQSEGRMSYREYRRQYSLPPGVSVENLSSKLTHDGVLSIQAPVQQRQDVLIPITHN